MKRREFAVLGLGEFGRSVAFSLAQGGASVLAVDHCEECVQMVADHVTYAVKADLTDPETLHMLGIQNMDVAVVCISDNLEASILATIISKQSGVPFVMAKARDELQASVLTKVGADQIIFPERSMGVRIARNLIAGNFVDIIELSGKFSMVEVCIPGKWAGKTLRELNLRNIGLNMIAKKEEDEITMVLEPDQVLKRGDIYILVGSNEALARIPEE
jgi:trk system potassium uptake protein TrkA